MPRSAPRTSEAELAAELGGMQSGVARRKFLAANRSLTHPGIVERLAPLVVDTIRTDAKQALLLAEGTLLIARKLRRKQDIATALRAKGNALFACNDTLGAVEYHEQAFTIYESLTLC